MRITNHSAWQKSSFSSPDGNINCIEITSVGESVSLRESDAPATVLTAKPVAVRALLMHIKTGCLTITPEMPQDAEAAGCLARSRPSITNYPLKYKEKVDMLTPNWQKSSFCSGDPNSDCLEVDAHDGQICLRESDVPATVLIARPVAVRALLAQIKAGRLNITPHPR